MNVENTAPLTFISEYADEDVKDSLNELMQENLLPSSSILISRVRVKFPSADHLCTVQVKLPAEQIEFTWPTLPGYPDFFREVKRL